MKIHSKTFASPLLLALVGTLALAGCKKQEQSQTATPDPTSSAPTEAMPGPAETAPAAANAGAVTVASVTVGNTAGADKTVAPLTTLSSKDTIIVSVKTDGSASNVAVSAKLTYQDGQVAGEQNATLNTTGAETTNLSFSKPDGWPAGTYTAQVMVDGKPAGNPQTITVK